tara:strand:- start:443 stop:2290 length:1848 start_codon:yes stop_codon:yes gene_type:complete
MKLEIENWKPDIKNISENIRLGPQKDILNLVDDINRRYICATWISGNRSYLRDDSIKPIGVTPKFRFKAGYRQSIVDTLMNRFHQYSKPGTLETLFSRNYNTQYSREQFQSLVLDLNSKMKDYRSSGLQWQDNSEVLKEAINVMMNKINQQKELIENINADENNNYTCELDIYTADMNNLWPGTRFSAGLPDDLNPETVDAIEWETAMIVFNVHIKKPKLRFCKKVDRDEVNEQAFGGLPAGSTVDLGELEVEDINLSFGLNIQEWLNALINQSMDISEIGTHNFATNRSRSNRTYSIANQNSIYVQNIYKCAEWHGNMLSSEHKHLAITAGSTTSNRNVVLFPYVSNGQEATEYRHMTDQPGLHGVCYGELDSAINSNLLQLEFVDLLMFIPAWLTWNCNSSNPLNGISKLTLIADKRLSKEAWNDIGFDTFDRHLRLCDLFAAHVPNNERYGGYRNSMEESLRDQMEHFINGFHIGNNSERAFLLESMRNIYGYSSREAIELLDSCIELNGEQNGMLQIILEHYINANYAMQEYVKDDCYYWKETTREDEFEQVMNFLCGNEEKSLKEEVEQMEEDLFEMDHPTAHLEETDDDREVREREMAIWVATRGGHNG